MHTTQTVRPHLVLPGDNSCTFSHVHFNAEALTNNKVKDALFSTWKIRLDIDRKSALPCIMNIKL